MPSFQSTIGERDIADELAETQRQISIAEFFEKNKQMLGFDSDARALVTAVKEGVDNALDATEEAGFLPDIYVEITESSDYYTVVVEDNGPGITEEQIPNIFGKLLYGSRFHAREQNRGQQGIGISAAVLYAQLSSGTPAKITSRTPKSDVAQYFELIIDTERNEPEIQVSDTTTWERPHGTRIELRMEANMRARQQLHDYITHTAVVNPHARLELVEPDASFKFDRATDELPAETEEIRPHPHGVELGTVIKMLNDSDSYSLSGFLQGEFTRVGATTAEQILEAFRDRYVGREIGWHPPAAGTEVEFARTVAQAVANKSSEATAAFADRVADRVDEESPMTQYRLEAIVDDVAADIEAEFETKFGTTVREKATAAAWEALTRDRVERLQGLIEDATSDRKDAVVVSGLADRLAAKFEDTDRGRVTNEGLRDFVDRAADMTEDREDATVGETARENVTEALWAEMETVPVDLPSVSEVAGDRDAAADFVAAMRSIDVMAPPTECLSPIRAELIEEGLRKEFDADFYTAATRDAEVHGGDPFVVEAGIAYGGELDDGQARLMRYANRVPLVYQRGACAITDVIRDIDWRNYNLDQPGGTGLPDGAAVILVHVASTNVPFTSESKDAVANVPGMEKEIELAVREASRDLKSHLNKRRSLEKRRKKQTVIADVLPTMAEKFATVTGRDVPDVSIALARIMNNVLVTRQVQDGEVTLRVENNTDAGADLEVTEILSAEPTDLSAGSTVEVDGEWFLNWEPHVGAGGESEVTYRLDSDASAEITIDGIESEKLTVEA